MSKRIQLLSFLCTMALVFGMATLGAHAKSQQSPQEQPPAAYPSQQPGQQAPSAQPPAGQSTQPPTAPETQAQPTPGTPHTFTGVVTKSGDKYILKDVGTGTTYDLDHQDLVKKFEGKKVRVQGTLDPNGKLIHIQ